MRFLTDHLNGDRNFKTDHPGQNLARCRAQLALLTSMEEQAAEMERLVRETVRDATDRSPPRESHETE